MPRASSDTVLRLIAVFKLAKGALLLLAAAAVLDHVHRNVADVVRVWARHLHLDPDGHLTRMVVRRATDLNPGRLVTISGGMIFYAALLLTEGLGLLARARWAEYLTVVLTASFVPLELYEIARHVSFVRIAVLAVNVAIVWYLIVRLRREAGERVIGSPP